MSDQKHRDHVQYQKNYFDANHHVFRMPIPDEVVAKTRAIVNAAKLHKDSHVLDVGTGMGVLIAHFIEDGVQEKNIVGCDLSTGMLAEAQARYPAVTFWQGDVLDLPQEFGNFDAIFFNACFGNLFDQQATLDSTRKRLNPGGRIVISHPLGNAFVAKLNAMDAKLVLSLLPSKDQLQQWSKQMNIGVSEFIDEHEYYLAILQAK